MCPPPPVVRRTDATPVLNFISPAKYYPEQNPWIFFWKLMSLILKSTFLRYFSFAAYNPNSWFFFQNKAFSNLNKGQTCQFCWKLERLNLEKNMTNDQSVVFIFSEFFFCAKEIAWMLHEWVSLWSKKLEICINSINIRTLVYLFSILYIN